MKKKIYPSFFFLCITSFLCFFSCSRPESIRNKYIAEYQQGKFEEALIHVNTYIDKRMPKKDFRKSKDAVWVLLDKATIEFAAGDVSSAAAHYNLALEAIDYYQQNVAAETAGQFLLEDSAKAYAGEDYEQILARLYLGLALLQKGDVGNAIALLKQAETTQQLKRELYRKNEATQNYQLIDNVVAKYLFAILLEKQGDLSNAMILYKQAAGLAKNLKIESDIIRLEKGISNKDKATVIFVCHNGRSPYKISTTGPASMASGVALEVFLASQGTAPAFSSLGGIPVPEFQDIPQGEPIPTYVNLLDQRRPLQTWYNIHEVAHQQLEQQKPVIIARGVARFLIRRSLVGITNHQNNNGGALFDLAMLAANLATRADTRSWITLPYSLDLAKFDLEPGIYPIQISSSQYKEKQNLKLEAGDFCLINIFNIMPGITTVHIPTQFKTATTN
ncbi:MAG: hypothetical protein K0S74_770 [Chlamydiales bacterium]|jgi:hypothetical protein|nr:hypothetical protein [Chlamydiales bacterium]